MSSERVAARFASETLDKSWLMGVRRGWLALMDPNIRNWDDVDAAFKRLGVFVKNLSEQVFFVRRGPNTAITMKEGLKLAQVLKLVAESVADHRGRAKHWRNVAEGKSLGGTFTPAEGESMFKLYKEDFVEATKVSVERKGGGMWDHLPLTDLLDKALKILREDAQTIKDHDKANPATPYEPVAPAYKEFDLYGMKVVIDDDGLLPSEIKDYIRFFDETYQRMKQKGFAKAWYGVIFVKCEKCGGENPLGADYGVGGDYSWGKDVVRIYSRPSKGLVDLVAHELGHRYWFKQMSQTQRGKFETLVRVKNKPKPKDPEELKVWEEAWDDNGKPVFPVSEYGGSNIAEAWAEVFADYVVGKDMTRDQIESFRSVMVKTARTETVDEAWIERLRKDFLTLMKNIPRVKEYDTGAELREGFKTYRTNFRKFMFDEFLNPRKDQDDASFESVRKPAWDFYTELTMPLGYPDGYNSQEMLFDRYSREAGAWERRLRAKAQTFWKTLKDTLSYRTDSKVDVEVADVDRLVLEGFQVEIRAFKASEGWQQEAFSKFKEGLRQYRKKAVRFLPWLIKRQLPLVLDFESKIDEGGEYHGTYIRIAMSAITGNSSEWTSHMLAHEMGHHLFKGLSKSAREFWDTAIRQDYGPLDVDQLLDQWPENLKWSSDFVEYMSTKDPVLALQVDVLSLAKGGDKGYEKRDDFENVYSPTLAVPKNPITGYAGKNTEESFCEAIGRLVGYGPATVLPQIKHWLEVAIPGMVKLASVRVAERSKRVNLGYRVVDTRTGEAYSKILPKKDKPKLLEQAKKLHGEGKNVGVQTVEVHVPESWKKGDDLEPYAPKDVLEGLKQASINDFLGDTDMTPLRKFQAALVVSRFNTAADTQLEVGKWYKHKHVGETYFLVKSKQKNGGWSGSKVVFDRAHPKATSYSVRPGGLGSNQWVEVKNSDVPDEVKAT